MTATENTERNKGTIAKRDNSGTAVVEVRVGVGEVELEVELAGMIIVCVLLQLLFLLIKFSGRFMSE